MDRLRSPGGCPWDAEQSFATLAPYVLEETYEVLAALDEGDAGHLCEELGDLLLQVVFLSRVASEDTGSWGRGAPFTIDDVTDGIIAKLVRRHPHVFGSVTLDDASQVERQWEDIKAAERAATVADEPPRSSIDAALDGVPPTLPALAKAQKVLDRLNRVLPAGEGATILAAGPAAADRTDATLVAGWRLLAMVAELSDAGIDAEAALRSAATHLVARVRDSSPDR